jgi:hypothetical protein
LTAQAWSLQTYLVFNILAWIPDRQRTIRELEVGRTLVREGESWVIRHGPVINQHLGNMKGT